MGNLVGDSPVDCGCPGGKNGNALASTTLNLCVPYTLAWLSTTAIVSFAGPILHVAAACHIGATFSSIHAMISWSVLTLGPGLYSSPIAMPWFLMYAQKSRWRLKAARARSRSAGSVSQLGLMRGGSNIEALDIETLPLLRTVMSAVEMLA